ncbi:DMT family transporter [Paracoccus sp. TK19116]|uniref:DMT family transporter n=1 Tax=Paracoccus albicereus TaxID=2922394 RepID=A0ABT1MRC5_9RHOB|nr:DMT family transporter [Paracoccus albicereus]MCQ0970847.1 DMT family transporter [Paracoccus albicereus]
MLLTGACFVAVNAIVRWLDGSVPAPQAAFIRFLFGLLFLTPTLIPALRRGFPRDVWRLFAARGILHVAAVIAWFYAMSRITIAEVTAIGFLNPIVVTVGAALFLGEALSRRRIGAITVALVGALIVLRPGLRTLDPGHLSQVVAALCFGASYIVAKQLTGKAPASAIVAVLSLTVAIGLAPVAYAVWVPPTLFEVGMLALVAVFATAGHYTMMRAFEAAPLTVTQPVTFLQLLWAAMLAWFVFGEPLDHWVMIGGALMIGAISYITWREARRDGAARTPPVSATKG